MKFTKVLPYVLYGGLLVTPFKLGYFQGTNESLHTKITTTVKPEKSITYKIRDKAQELCDAYISNVLQGQQNIKHCRQGRRKAILNELPGAPVGFHCIYGQYTQLNRALSELGDTLSIIPYTSRHSCPRFRSDMQKKYGNSEYAGALHNGKMMKPDAYRQALDAFLKRNKVTDATPEDEKQRLIAKFRQSNYSVDELHPGTILIIQKSANPNNTHAVMFLGRGYLKHGSFVSDEKGAYMYAGFNNESIADIFKNYNTDRIFAADIYNIALVAYANEFEKIKNLDNSDLYRFVYDAPQERYTYTPDRNTLKRMAEDKYFDKKTFRPTGGHTNVASMGLGPVYLVANDLKKSR